MPIKRLTVIAALVSLLLATGSVQAKVDTTAKAKAPASTHVVSKSHTSSKTTSKAATVSKASEKTAAKSASSEKSHSVASAKTHSAAKSHKVAAAHNNRSVAKTHSKTATHSVAKTHTAHKKAGADKRHAEVAAVAPSTTTSVLADSPSLPTAVSASLGAAFANTADKPVTLSVGGTGAANASDGSADVATAGSGEDVTDLRKALIGLAMNLRDTRYVRGGRDPSTGFDCSGFVRYVFAHAIGIKLPTNSASQFLDGLKVSRDEMKPGDLVFFHSGRNARISHVGIYISNGRFIHSPATGKSVQVSSLSDSYWAKHFAGAKRPEAMALVAHNG